MSGTVVVPLDGSALAELAIPFTLALAADRTGAQLLLLRAVPGRGPHGTEPDAASVAALADAESYLRAVAGRLATPSRAVDYAARCGNPAQVIAEQSADPAVAYVAMSTHGQSGRGRWLFGSTADEILRRSRAPVLLVPTGGPRRWAQGAPQGVLVPLDGSALAETALGPAAALAADLGATLTLLRVAGMPYELSGYEATPGDPATEIAEAEVYLEQCAAPRCARGLTVATRVELGYPATVITAAAAEGPLLIALATHGYGGAAHLVLGSIATSVVQRADSPVLLVRPPALRPPLAVAPSRDLVALTLTREELALVERGLRELEAGDYPAEPLRALLARLAEAAGGVAAR